MGNGALAVRFVHGHQLGLLLATQSLWVLSLIFIRVRARRAGGKFLESESVFYSGFGIPFFIVGLLLAACFYTIFS